MSGDGRDDRERPIRQRADVTHADAGGRNSLARRVFSRSRRTPPAATPRIQRGRPQHSDRGGSEHRFVRDHRHAVCQFTANQPTLSGKAAQRIAGGTFGPT